MCVATVGLLMGLAIPAQLDPLTYQGSLTEQLRTPARITVALDGTVLVTEPPRNLIVRFDAAGTLLGTWSVPEGPVGIAAHIDGRYFVSLRIEPQVAIYDATFTRVGLLGDGDPLVTFVKPTDIAVSLSSGRIYVVDAGGDRVYGFEPGGAVSVIFGIRGELPGQFQYPSAVTVDELNNRLVVADHDNFRVQIFNTSGVFLQRFGYRMKYLPGGGEEGWMPRTLGLAVDASGRIFAADALMSTVRVFNSLGTELDKVLAYGLAPGDLQTPCDIAMSPDGSRLYVVNTNTSSVNIYGIPAWPLPAQRDGDDAGVTTLEGTNRSILDAYSIPTAAVSLPELGKPSPRGFRSTDAPHDDDQPPIMSADYEGPHMIEASIVCGRCHGIDGQPGDHVATPEGIEAACFSCHSSGGQGLMMPLHPSDRADAPVGVGRSHAWGVPAINATYGSIGPVPGRGMDLYLDDTGNIKCSTCHNQHSNDADTPYLRVDNFEGAMCRHCHHEHIGHTPAGPWQPTCTECHAAHDPFSENLSLIAGSVVNQTLGVDMTVRFLATEGANSYDDGDPADNDGICQVCHTSTSYHVHDGSGTPHHDGQSCIGCHPHDSGFMPAGGDCLSCHSSVQDLVGVGPDGGRRAVVGEFPEADPHAHYGSELGESACLVCHDQSTHMDGNVDLLDADSGALYTFVVPNDLSSDPDLSDFCASCHDADGAARLGVDAMDPFGGGNVPPDVAVKFQGTLQWDEWYGDVCFGQEGTLRQVNSHHDISDADQAWSGAKVECLDCHGAHTAGDSQPITDPLATNTPWTGTNNEFCLQCHWGGFGPGDPAFPAGVAGPTVPLRPLDTCDAFWEPWWVQYSWTHAAHGGDSKRGWSGYSGAPGTEVECLACHDAHGSYTPTNTLGNPYAIRDVVDGTPYVDDGVRPGAQWTGPPWDDVDSQGTVQDPVVVSITGIDVTWGELCQACHSNWLAAYDFHGFCTGCQTCHGHGQAWQNADWGDLPGDDTLCPHNNHCERPEALALVGDVCDETSDNVGAPCTNDGQCTNGLCDRTFDVTAVGDTTVADDDNLVACGAAAPTQTVWYSIVGTGNTMTVTTCLPGTAFDTNIQVFCDTCEALTCVAANDDDALCGTSTVASTVTFCSDPGQTYLIQVGGTGGAHGLVEVMIADGSTPCGTPDGCPAIGLVTTPERLTTSPLDPAGTSERTAPHPTTGDPVSIHAPPPDKGRGR